MKPIKQEDRLGCAVACVAFVLKISYPQALKLFKNGQTRVKNRANFYSPEIVKILKSKGLKCKWKRLDNNKRKELFNNCLIVFLEKSKTYPYGHFLARSKNKWMDPWINLHNQEIKAGFRKKLPEGATYIIYQIQKS